MFITKEVGSLCVGSLLFPAIWRYLLQEQMPSQSSLTELWLISPTQIHQTASVYVWISDILVPSAIDHFHKTYAITSMYLNLTQRLSVRYLWQKDQIG